MKALRSIRDEEVPPFDWNPYQLQDHPFFEDSLKIVEELKSFYKHDLQLKGISFKDACSNA